MPQYKTIPATDKCYSEVASIGCRTLCVTVPELVDCGVSENTIKGNLRQHRQGLVYCWPHHKEGNTIYIHYDGLKERYKLLVNSLLCKGVEANIWTTSQEAQKRQKELTAVCCSLPNMVEVYPEDLAHLNDSGFFEAVDAQKVARAAAWLRLWRKLDVKTARKMGFTSIIDLQTALFKHCINDQLGGFAKFPKPINTIRVLDRKAREFATDGLITLIGGYFGNANREKIDNIVHAVLMDLASSPLKHSFEDISMMYNTMPEYENLVRMTTSAIKQHLNIPKHRKVWYYLRHGKQEGDNVYQSQALRETPSVPDQLWSIDGTTAQLYYRDNYGRWVGQSKIDRYTIPCDTRKKISYFDKIGLFMVELPKPYKYKQQGITLTIGGVKYNYIVPDPDDSANDFMFSNENMYREFKICVNINNPQYIELLDKTTDRPIAKAVQKEKFIAAIAAMKNGDGAKIVDFLRKQEEYGYDYAFRSLRNERKVLEIEGLRPTGTGDYFGVVNDKKGEHLGWKESTKTEWNAYESHEEDVANGIDEKPAKSSRFNIANTLNNY